ncbi:MAG: protein translocase subunit SecD [Patescibacteria group bacterium]|nr:protein translocase subunit SecD [Patescibacteria group bacterium]
MNPRTVLWLIVSVTLIAVFLDLPAIPVKFDYGPIKVDTSIGGYEINLFNGAFTRDLKIKEGLDISGGVRVTLRADMASISADRRTEALDSVKSVLERRVNLFGVSEPNVQTLRVGSDYRVVVELPGVYDTSQALSLIGQTAKLEFKEFDAEATKSANPKTLTVNDVYKPTGLTGADLKRAYLTFDQTSGAPQVGFDLTADGGQKFKKVTEELLKKPSPQERVLAIFLDGVPISTPEVTAVISNQGVITGNFTSDQAKDLALKLNAGALPVPIGVIAQENIGATLGRDSVNRSVFAGAVGLIIVAVFMAGLYGRFGLIADVALIIYGLLTLAIYKLTPVVLTLPGIAGFLLSIGMAVDANILIFERIKEELRWGKSLRPAMELGFGRAWTSIRDANMATLITCFVLFNPLGWSFLNTSGPVRGFALTLALGVLLSLFTGIVVSRTLIRVFYKG